MPCCLLFDVREQGVTTNAHDRAGRATELQIFLSLPTLGWYSLAAGIVGAAKRLSFAVELDTFQLMGPGDI